MTHIEQYKALENKISKETDTYFVVRDTNHPAEDLTRNWSTTVGGFSLDGHEPFATLDEAIQADMEYHEASKPEHEYRYHPAYDGFCPVHYEGLGAFALESDNINDAIIEADLYSLENDLAITSEAGDGHFFNADVVGFHKVREGRYIFEVKF